MSDSLVDAIAVVASDGCVAFANRAMRQLLRSVGPIRIKNKRLDGDRSVALKALVQRAAVEGTRAFGRFEHPERLLEVCAMPLQPRDGYRHGSGWAMLLVRDVQTEREVDLDYLASMYGLTVTEARLTRALCNGATVQEAAERMKISPETVRTHLKRIYKKTGSRGQLDLVRLATGGLHAHLDPRRPPKQSSTQLMAIHV